MLSYKYDLSSAEQTKLDALIADEDMTNKVVLLVTEEFESDIHFCDLLKLYADCATLIFADNTVHHVDIHLAICIYNGDFEEIILDM